MLRCPRFIGAALPRSGALLRRVAAPRSASNAALVNAAAAAVCALRRNAATTTGVRTGVIMPSQEELDALKDNAGRLAKAKADEDPADALDLLSPDLHLSPECDRLTALLGEFRQLPVRPGCTRKDVHDKMNEILKQLQPALKSLIDARSDDKGAIISALLVIASNCCRHAGPQFMEVSLQLLYNAVNERATHVAARTGRQPNEVMLADAPEPDALLTRYFSNYGILLCELAPYSGKQAPENMGRGLAALDVALEWSRRLFASRDVAEAELGILLKMAGRNRYLAGDVAGSMPLLTDAVATLKRCFPAGDHPEVARALTDLSNSVAATGSRHAEAAALVKEAIAVERTLAAGKPSGDIAACLTMLSQHQTDAGDAAAAVESAREAAAMMRQIPSEAQSPAFCLMLARYAKKLVAVEKYGEALDAAEEALVMAQLLSQPEKDSPETAQILGELSLIHLKLGNEEQSKVFTKEHNEMVERLAEKQKKMMEEEQ